MEEASRAAEAESSCATTRILGGTRYTFQRYTKGGWGGRRKYECSRVGR